MPESAFDVHSGAIAPVAEEITLEDLPVTGAIPDELQGTLFRNGPNPLSGRFAGNDMLSWWVGSAMLHSLELRQGRAVRYTNRWARTNAWARHVGHAVRPEPAWEANPNIHVISHGGRTLALSEGGAPFSIDASNEPSEPYTYGGALPAGMTAHPKIDPLTGELFYFRASWQEPRLAYGALSPTGQPTVQCSIDLAAPGMIHDFAITATRALILDLSVGLDMTLLERGAAMPVGWDDHRPSKIGVMPRQGGAVQWIEIAPCFVMHVINAYDQDADTVVIDVVRYPHFLRFDDDTRAFRQNPLGCAWRYTLDLIHGVAKEAAMEQLHSELPRINEHFTGQRYRFAYAVEQPTTSEMRGLVKLDLETGGRETHLVAEGDQNSEPIFVSRGEDPGAEDNGWILACVYRRETDTTDVIILDAEDFSGSAVAQIHLPVRVPAGFHGAWVPAP